MLLPSFARVTACLQRNHPPEVVSNPDALRMAVLTGPTVATMSTSHVVKDEAMGITYMDTVTTLVGMVTLSGPKTGDLGPGAYNIGCHRPGLVGNKITAFGQ